MIERKKKFTIGKKNFVVEFPNVGQLIDLESLRCALSGNRYGSMIASGVVSMYNALDLIDAISFYQICAPEVGKYYNIENYTAMQMDEIAELIKAWRTEIQPWYNGVLNEIKAVYDEIKPDEEEEG